MTALLVSRLPVVSDLPGGSAGRSRRKRTPQTGCGPGLSRNPDRALVTSSHIRVVLLLIGTCNGFDFSGDAVTQVIANTGVKDVHADETHHEMATFERRS